MRVGVIGTGFGGRVVAPAFAATPGCSVVDVVSARSPSDVASLCRRPDVDLVSVHAPPFLHRPFVGLAVDAGKHVLCDKPFGVSAAEAVAMLDAATAAGVVHAVNFEFRHDPDRIALAAADVGRPRALTYTHLSPAWRRRAPDGWQFSSALGGGWIGAWAAHAVDLVRFSGLGEVVDVGGVRHRWLGHGDAEDGLTAWLTTDRGVTVSFHSSGAAGRASAPAITLAGDADVAVSVARGAGDPHVVPMRRWAEVLRDAVHDGAPVGTTFADGLACALVLDRLRALPVAAH